MVVGIPPVYVLLEGVTVMADAEGIVPTTVTVAVQVDAFPLLSVTVRVTVLFPIFEQLKVLGETLIEAIPQMSLDPLFTCDAVMEAVPPERVTVTFLQTALGAVLSTTVTIAVPVAVLLLLSVTVSVTVFAPTFEQLKEVLLNEIEATPQASAEPLLIAAAVVVALPEASR